ncbi:MAG: ABC transporter permease, partial [Nanoarchaeota archaeon]|nr:ABC transporter permease [Nanoarchaeota archaeon]
GIGVVLGISFSKLVEIIAANAGYAIIKVSFPLPLIIGTLMFAFVVGTLSGIVPAYNASKLRPVDALRYE